jgi:hypothetical protein
MIHLNQIPDWPAFNFSAEYSKEKNTYFIEFYTIAIITAKDNPSQKYRMLCMKKHETIKTDPTTFRIEMCQILAMAIAEAERAIKDVVLTAEYVKNWNNNPMNVKITDADEEGRYIGRGY